METIRQFAERCKVRVKRDGCNVEIIAGKNQSHDGVLVRLKASGRIPDRPQHKSHIFDGYDGRLGLCLMLATKQQWTWAKKKLRAAGFVIRQDGDTEGIATFDPADHRQAMLAIRMAGIRTRRRATQSQLDALAASRKRGESLATVSKPMDSGALLAQGSI